MPTRSAARRPAFSAPFVQQTEALLQVVERSAVRDQEPVELA